MFFAARIGLADLAAISRRLAISLESGIDLRRVFERESQLRSNRLLRRHLQTISEQLSHGSTLTDAITLSGSYFPPLFREMAAVGERSGHLPEVFYHLAEHYEHQLKLRRDFLAGITWPIIELVVAVSVVGLLIYLMGLIGQFTGHTVDILGLGLVGVRGLSIYVGILIAVTLVATFVWQALSRGLLWIYPVQWLMMKVPVVGRILETLAMARLAWTLNLVGNTEMALPAAIPLCLRSTQNLYYSRFADDVARRLRQGNSLTDSLAATRVFPDDFLESLDVGERSGRLPEAMALLATQYQDQARRAMAALNVVAGFLVWLLVASLIVLVIFRLFSFYIGILNQAIREI